jgi:hypothetical protein
VFVFLPFFYYPWKHLPCEAFNAGVLGLHPTASACCSCSEIVTTVTATTPSTANAATMAIMAIDAYLSCSLDEWFIFVNKLRKDVCFIYSYT